eukprot:XP_001703094.1 predicted protein [Chlamydomonas reinhardtii]
MPPCHVPGFCILDPGCCHPFFPTAAHSISPLCPDPSTAMLLTQTPLLFTFFHARTWTAPCHRVPSLFPSCHGRPLRHMNNALAALVCPACPVRMRQLPAHGYCLSTRAGIAPIKYAKEVTDSQKQRAEKEAAEKARSTCGRGVEDDEGDGMLEKLAQMVASKQTAYDALAPEAIAALRQAAAGVQRARQARQAVQQARQAPQAAQRAHLAVAVAAVAGPLVRAVGEAVGGGPGLDIGTYTFEDRPPVHLPPGGSSNLSSGNGQQSIDSARFDIIGSGSTDPAMDAASAPGPATVLDFRALTGPAFTLAPGVVLHLANLTLLLPTPPAGSGVRLAHPLAHLVVLLAFQSAALCRPALWRRHAPPGSVVDVAAAVAGGAEQAAGSSSGSGGGPTVWLRRGVVEYPDVALLFSYSHNPSSGSPGRPGSSSNSSSDWTWAGEQLVVSSNDVGLADAATASGSGAATAAADVGAEEVVARLRGVAMTCPGGGPAPPWPCHIDSVPANMTLALYGGVTSALPFAAPTRQLDWAGLPGAVSASAPGSSLQLYGLALLGLPYPAAVARQEHLLAAWGHFAALDWDSHCVLVLPDQEAVWWEAAAAGARSSSGSGSSNAGVSQGLRLAFMLPSWSDREAALLLQPQLGYLKMLTMAAAGANLLSCSAAAAITTLLGVSHNIRIPETSSLTLRGCVYTHMVWSAAASSVSGLGPGAGITFAALQGFGWRGAGVTVTHTGALPADAPTRLRAPAVGADGKLLLPDVLAGCPIADHAAPPPPPPSSSSSASAAQGGGGLVALAGFSALATSDATATAAKKSDEASTAAAVAMRGGGKQRAGLWRLLTRGSTAGRVTARGGRRTGHATDILYQTFDSFGSSTMRALYDNSAGGSAAEAGTEAEEQAAQQQPREGGSGHRRDRAPHCGPNSGPAGAGAGSCGPAASSMRPVAPATLAPAPCCPDSARH